MIYKTVDPQPKYGEFKGTDLAPEGTIWVCQACGKKARSKYGFDSNNKSTALSYGYDESCVLNAVLCEIEGVIE